MKISIITVVLNGAATIRNALESIKNQMGTFDLEHIIVDGMSSDGTIDIIRQYSPLSAIIVEPDNGIFDAMNKGIRQATGDIIGILNADDIYYNQLILNDVHNIFYLNKHIDIVYGNVLYHSASNDNSYVRYWRSQPFSVGFFEKGLMLPHTALFVRKSVYEQMGLYQIEYGLAADYEFMFRILKMNAHQSFFLNKTLIKMKAGGRSNNGFKTYWRITQAHRSIWEFHQMKYPIQLYYRRPMRKVREILEGFLLNLKKSFN